VTKQSSIKDFGNSRKMNFPKLTPSSSQKVSKQADLGNSLSFSTLLDHILGVTTHLASKPWQDLKIGKALPRRGVACCGVSNWGKSRW
jgi:hypothetical protein